MKNIILILALFIIENSMSAVGLSKSERNVPKTSAIQHDLIFISSTPSAHYLVATSDSFDPFASKTNKYAESRILRLVSNQGILVKFGGSTITDVASTDSEYYIPANTIDYIGVDDLYPYVRIISITGTSASVFVTEVK